MVHLIPIRMSTDATKLTHLYLQEVVRLHGVAKSIVSDRDPRFMSKFWSEVNRILGTRLLMSTTFHLQTDGATERANQTINVYPYALGTLGPNPSHHETRSVGICKPRLPTPVRCP